MKKKITAIIIFLLIAAASFSQISVSDGFETPGLSPCWRMDRMEAHSIEMQSAIVHSGHQAAKITLRPGDVFEKGKGKSKGSERDELREANNLVSVEGTNYEFKFSLFLPDSFPLVPTRLVIAQWKQSCQKEICDDDSPPLAVRYVSGRLYITVKTDSSTITVYQTNDEIRNKWLEFTFHVLFSKSNNGEVKAWLNDKQIVNYKGMTCYSEKRGYPSNNHFYFKMGLYRDLMPQTMSLFIDDYSKKELTAK